MAVESSFVVPDAVSFTEAIALTQTLMSGVDQGTVTAAVFEATVRALVNSENGARGFFVTYLSDARPLADQPAPVIAALSASPEIVAPLLVKNLAMSTAMAMTHCRNQDEAMVKASEQVRSRTAQLIQVLQFPQVQTEAQQLMRAIATGTGAYQAFLERWGYDLEQQHAIQRALEETGVVAPSETKSDALNVQ